MGPIGRGISDIYLFYNGARFSKPSRTVKTSSSVLFFGQFHELFADSGHTAVLLDALGCLFQLLHNRLTAAELDRLDEIGLQFGFLVEDAQSPAVAEIVHPLSVVRLIAEERYQDQRHTKVEAFSQRVVLRGKERR